MSAARLAPRARSDLRAAIRWISQDSPSAARGLREAISEAVERLGDYPELGRERPGLLRQRYRVFSMTGYPDLLIYDAVQRPPLVMRILHGARDLPEALSDL